MHFVVKTVQEHYPEVMDFASDFDSITKASTGLITVGLVVDLGSCNVDSVDSIVGVGLCTA